MMGRRGWLPACDFCLDYVSGICTDQEKLAFESHLPYCEDCQMDLEELRIVWEALPTDMEQIEPPLDLKSQVMNAVLAAEVVNPKVHASAAARRRPLFGKRSTSALFAAAIAAIMLISLWNVQLYRDRSESPLPVEEALSVSAAHIRNWSGCNQHPPRSPSHLALHALSIMVRASSLSSIYSERPSQTATRLIRCGWSKTAREAVPVHFAFIRKTAESVCLPCRSPPISWPLIPLALLSSQTIRATIREAPKCMAPHNAEPTIWIIRTRTLCYRTV